MSSLKFYIKPAPGERVQAELTLPAAQESFLLGTVKTAAGDPAVGCAVLLQADGGGVPVHQAVTDETGRFVFGPLPGDQLYIINIYHDDTHVRTVEIGV